ncbi:MAG: glycosyltransferase family 39 protein, partial [Stellaceae bacterium]
MSASELLPNPVTASRGERRYRDAALALAILALALAVRFYGLGSKPFWYDEILTINRASLPFLDLLYDSFVHNHSPLYFLIVSPLTGFNDEAMLRLPSALFGALACPLVAASAARIGGRASGAMAGLLMALSPTMVTYSQEARCYALLTLIVAVALYGLIRLALDTDAAALPFRHPGAARIAWATYLVATVAAVNTHAIAVFWGIAGFIATLAMVRRGGARRQGLIRNSVIVHVVAAILCAPCCLAFFLIITAQRPFLEAISWVPPLTFAQFSHDVASLFLFQVSSPITNRVVGSHI